MFFQVKSNDGTQIAIRPYTLNGNSVNLTLVQALKAANLVEDGVEAKYVIQDGEVLVNGEPDTRRGRKLYDGDVISYHGEEVRIEK